MSEANLRPRGLLTEIHRGLPNHSSDPDQAVADSTRLTELDALNVDRVWENNEAVDFVTASEQYRRFGAEKCLVIKPAMYDIPPEDFDGFLNRVNHAIQEQRAVFQLNGEDQVVTLFPDRPEEAYSRRSFFSSLTTLYRVELKRRARAQASSSQVE